MCRRILWRGLSHTIPGRWDQRQRRTARPERPLACDAGTYPRRNVMEHGVNRLKQGHGIAPQYEQRAANPRAKVVMSALLLPLGR